MWLNDGTGTFTDSGQSLGYTDSWGEVRLGDLDGDGDFDCLMANQAHGSSVWLNDGTANFSAGSVYPDAGTEKLALGDVEGDGDLDAFTTNYLVTNKVWLNDGAAGFTPVDSLFGIGAASIGAGDMDNDGDLDVIVGRLDGYGPTSVYFNTTPTAGTRRGEIVPSSQLIWLGGPNPFGAAAEICYRVHAPGEVTLRLFDVQGREVRTIARGPHAAGQYSVTIPGAGLSAGVYFCRLSVPGATAPQIATTGKMLRLP